MDALGLLKKSVPLARSAVVAIATILILFVSCSLLVADQTPLHVGSGISLASASALVQRFLSLGSLEAYAESVQALEMEMKNISGKVESLKDSHLAAQLAMAALNQTVQSKEGALAAEIHNLQASELAAELALATLNQTVLLKEGAFASEIKTLRASDLEHSNAESHSAVSEERLDEKPEHNIGAEKPVQTQLERCSSGMLLGGWQDSTYIPLPFDIMDVFQAEAEGKLSAEQETGLQYKGTDFTSVADAFPSLKHKPSSDGGFTFRPPCFYHTYSKGEFVRLFAGKWLYFLGDSNTRALVLGLLTILDPTHNQPFDEQRWFNSSGKVRFPHVETIDYFLRDDGSILSKFGETGGTVPGKNEVPSEPYSVRISFRMQSDVRRMLWSFPDTLGEDNWRPDFLYFNTGNWDSGEAVHNNVSWSVIEDAYGPLFEKIATTCKPERQVCVWGTLTSNVHLEHPYQHSRLALAQWRQLARIARAQSEEGRPKSLHVLDRFWAAHVSDQGRGGHYGHEVNTWDIQRLMHVYHGIVRTTVDVKPPKSKQLETGGNKLPECTLKVDGHLASAKCDWFPELVTFGDGCVMERTDPGEDDGGLHMWERNCEAKVVYSTGVA
ncbi:hypothetical protein KFL_001800010 [Klebsormidium nitens]|uniref:Uncharacterized protein n=1 Tax=Klebsormidium nitens TaxID=105231 RepID=A0A1Y1I154_KLENI|nr:hypothetical protein KFL_001800010 [Klebsormidium nitens]|eukprot:GAQ84193.1 hypothetical protein KFL_001800010 [Klebsormidium nitens]